MLSCRGHTSADADRGPWGQSLRWVGMRPLGAQSPGGVAVDSYRRHSWSAINHGRRCFLPAFFGNPLLKQLKGSPQKRGRWRGEILPPGEQS